MSKEKPTGWVAICRCGKAVGAIDALRTSSKDASEILGEWLLRGDKIVPQFGTWGQRMEICECDDKTTQTNDLHIEFPKVSDPAALEELVQYSTVERLLHILYNYSDEADAKLLQAAINKKALLLESQLKDARTTIERLKHDN